MIGIPASYMFALSGWTILQLAEDAVSEGDKKRAIYLVDLAYAAFDKAYNDAEALVIEFGLLSDLPLG